MRRWYDTTGPILPGLQNLTHVRNMNFFPTAVGAEQKVDWILTADGRDYPAQPVDAYFFERYKKRHALPGLTNRMPLSIAKYAGRLANGEKPAGVMTPLMREWAESQYDPQAALAMVDSWHPIGRMATIEEIGEVCAFLASDEAAFVTGQVICPDGGAANEPTRNLPCVGGGDDANYASPRSRHPGGVNAVFCDGHVEHVKRAKLFDIHYAPERWNNDHQPHPETW